MGEITAAFDALFPGGDLVYLPEVDSTNSFIRRLPSERIRSGLSVVTDSQSEGRGRRGRGWSCPAGAGLLFSVVLSTPPVAADAVSLMTLAVYDTLGHLGLDPQIKWPNDVLLGGRKTAGILADIPGDLAPGCVIVGAGVNVLRAPDIPEATCIAQWTPAYPDRTGIFVGLLRSLARWQGRLAGDADAVFRAWEAALATVGKPVRAVSSSGVTIGEAIGVERSGALRILDADGREHALLAGDVSIRGD